MLRGRWFAWLLYWLAAAAAQWFCAYMLAVLLVLILRGEADTLRNLLSMLVATGMADIVAISLLGWLALANRKAPPPWRMPLRLLCTALGVGLVLCIPVLMYKGILGNGPAQPVMAAVPTPALAVWLGIIGFHLPGWLRPRAG